jgi:hypothetical protein
MTETGGSLINVNTHYWQRSKAGLVEGAYMSHAVQNGSKLLSLFPFIGHGNPDNNLELSCIF